MILNLIFILKRVQFTKSAWFPYKQFLSVDRLIAFCIYPSNYATVTTSFIPPRVVPLSCNHVSLEPKNLCVKSHVFVETVVSDLKRGFTMRPFWCAFWMAKLWRNGGSEYFSICLFPFTSRYVVLLCTINNWVSFFFRGINSASDKYQ